MPTFPSPSVCLYLDSSSSSPSPNSAPLILSLQPYSFPPNTCPYFPLTPTSPLSLSPPSPLLVVALLSRRFLLIPTSSLAGLSALFSWRLSLASASRSPLLLLPPALPPPSQLPRLACCLPRLLSHLACVVWEGSPASSPSLRSMPWPLTF